MGADGRVTGTTLISEVRLGMPRAAARWSGGLNVARGRAFLTLFHVERHLLALSKGTKTTAGDGAMVDEYILAAILSGDKTKAFRFVKPFNCSSNHGSTFV